MQAQPRTDENNNTVPSERGRMILSERANYEEKRNFIRMKVDTVVTFTKAEGKERYEGRCRNLSGAGMLLETNKKLEMGDRLKVVIPSEGPDFSPLEAIVEVVRVIPEPDLHKFRMGVVIRKICN
jgi:hypothetical protein